MGDAGPLAVDAETSIRNVADAVQEPETKEVNVLVTGFGPFKSFPKNPSWLIASTLPPTLSLTFPADAYASSPTVKTITIKLHVYPSEVPVSYHAVSQLIPTLLDSDNATSPSISYDHVVHIGMAGGRNYYSFETQAHRSGYKIRDIDGLDGYNCGERRWKSETFSKHGPAPEILGFGYDERDVWGRWVGYVNGHNPNDSAEKKTLRVANEDANGNFSPVNSSSAVSGMGRGGLKGQEVDIRISHDAGHFLCDFIFFTSLAERWRQKLENAPSDDTLDRQHTTNLPVIFLHVPPATDSVAIDIGRQSAEGLIKAIVESWEFGFRHS